MTKLSNRDVDALVEHQFDDSLADGEEWATDLHEHRCLAVFIEGTAGFKRHQCELSKGHAGNHEVAHAGRWKAAWR